LNSRSESRTISSYDELFELFGIKKSNDDGDFVEIIHPTSGAIIKIPKNLVTMKESFSEQKDINEIKEVKVRYLRFTLFLENACTN
jgi:hypothetical protein